MNVVTFEASTPLRICGLAPTDVRVQVETALMREPGADLNAVADALAMSPRSLQRALALAGEHFQIVRTRVRLALADRLLVEPGSKVECVARDVGFQSTAHFVGWFRRHRGAAPSDFRRARQRLAA